MSETQFPFLGHSVAPPRPSRLRLAPDKSVRGSGSLRAGRGKGLLPLMRKIVPKM